jgi:hypothetical protein
MLTVKNKRQCAHVPKLDDSFKNPNIESFVVLNKVFPYFRKCSLFHVVLNGSRNYVGQENRTKI